MSVHEVNIPGVPGFRACANAEGFVQFIAANHLVGGEPFHGRFSTRSDNLWGLADALAKIRSDFEPDLPVADKEDKENRSNPVGPVVLWPTPTILEGSLSRFRLLLLAEGLVVAAGRCFLASFNRRTGFWNLGFVAVEPDRFVPVNLSFGLVYVAELDWSCNGIQAIEVTLKTRRKAGWPLENLHLFPPKRNVSNPDEITQLFLSPNGHVLTKTSRHLHQFICFKNDYGFLRKRMRNGNPDDYILTARFAADETRLRVDSYAQMFAPGSSYWG